MYLQATFFVGIAYCLEVLGQWDQFDSLHWMESVMFHLTAQRKAVASQSKAETEENLQVCKISYLVNRVTILFYLHKKCPFISEKSITISKEIEIENICLKKDKSDFKK
jgi:hypothetical protein